MNNKAAVTLRNYLPTCLIPVYFIFRRKSISRRSPATPVGSARATQKRSMTRGGARGGKSLPWILMIEAPSAREHRFLQQLVLRQTRRPMYSWGIKFSSREKNFPKRLAEERVRRFASTLVPFRPSIHFKPPPPPAGPSFSYFFFRPLRMHMILRMHHCVRAPTSYAAIRPRFATRAAAGSRLATFYLVPSVASSFPCPRILFLFSLANSYQFFVRFTTRRAVGAARTAGAGKSSQSKVCSYFRNYPAVKTRVPYGRICVRARVRQDLKVHRARNARCMSRQPKVCISRPPVCRRFSDESTCFSSLTNSSILIIRIFG